MPLSIIRNFQQPIYSLTLLLVNEHRCLHFAINQQLGLSWSFFFFSCSRRRQIIVLIDFEASTPPSIIQDIQVAVLLIIK